VIDGCEGVRAGGGVRIDFAEQAVVLSCRSSEKRDGAVVAIYCEGVAGKTRKAARGGGC